MTKGLRSTVKILLALFLFSSIADAKPKKTVKKSGSRSVRTSARRLSGSQVAAQKRAWDRSEQLRQRRLYEAAQRSAATAMNFQSRVDQAVEYGRRIGVDLPEFERVAIDVWDLC